MDQYCIFFTWIALTALTISKTIASNRGSVPIAQPYVINMGSPYGKSIWRQKRSMAKNLIRSMPPNWRMQRLLLEQHNNYRRQVPASNMLQLKWSTDLQKSAQNHADTCDFAHSRGRSNVGENLWAAPYSNYTDAVALWFKQGGDKECDCPDHYKHCCAHYMQVAWAATQLLGCGFSHCASIRGLYKSTMRYILVCHYNPSGNKIMLLPDGKLVPMLAFDRVESDEFKCSNCPEGMNKCCDGLCC